MLFESQRLSISLVVIVNCIVFAHLDRKKFQTIQGVTSAHKIEHKVDQVYKYLLSIKLKKKLTPKISDEASTVMVT